MGVNEIKLTRTDKTIIRIMIENNLAKVYYGKDLYSLNCFSAKDNAYTLTINGWYWKSFNFENNKIII